MAALISLALVQCAAPATPAAIPHLQWALQIAHENYPDTSLPVGHIEFLLGYAYWKSGDPKDADEWMSRGVYKLATVIGWGHPAYIRTLRQYRAFLVETKQRDKAQLILAQIDKLDHSKHPPIVASGSLAAFRTSPDEGSSVPSPLTRETRLAAIYASDFAGCYSCEAPDLPLIHGVRRTAVVQLA
jgi:hypothetical protein